MNPASLSCQQNKTLTVHPVQEQPGHVWMRFPRPPRHFQLLRYSLELDLPREGVQAVADKGDDMTE